MDSQTNVKLAKVEDTSSCSFIKHEIECAERFSPPQSKTDIKNEDTCQEAKGETEVTTSDNINNFCIPNMPQTYKDKYEAYINEVITLSSVPITKSVTPEHIENFKHYNLRYYDDKYCINFKTSETSNNDTLIRIHSNKLILISLASGNDIITCGKNITDIDFVINNIDRSNIRLGGKRKTGAKIIEPHTILCRVKCEGITKTFNIRAGVHGRIIEINELVKNDPNLLRTHPKGNGFLAVVAPKGHPSNYDKVISDLKLLNEEEYIKHVMERPPKCSEPL